MVKNFVLAITGPAGSGKSTLAEYTAKHPGWVAVSEDHYWVKHGWGSGLRSPEQEKVVQQEVVKEIKAKVQKGKKVVFEFILYYPTAPNPLTNYQDMLTKAGVQVRTIALKPPIDEIMRRLTERGRSNDINNLEAKRKDTEHQLACLEAKYIKPEWLVDPTHMTTKELYEKYVEPSSQ